MTKKSKKLDDELHRLRKSHSKVTVEATRFQDLHKKGLMDYTRRKADFVMKIEELRKYASDRSQADRDRDWSKKFSDLQKQLQDAEANYNAYRVGWCGQVENYRRKLKMATDKVVCLQR